MFFLYHLIDKKKYAQGIPGSDQFSGTLEPDKGTWDQASPDPRCPDLLLTVSPVPSLEIKALVPCPPSPIPHLTILDLQMPEGRFFFHF